MAKVEQNVWDLDASFTFTKEQLLEAQKFDRGEALSLVNTYYDFQTMRKSMANKVRALKQGHAVRDDKGDYNPVFLTHLESTLKHMEEKIAKGLAAWARSTTIGKWMTSLPGVGDIIAAGIMANVDFHRCCCPNLRHLRRNEIPEEHKKICPGLVSAGHLISFAGQMDPAKYVWGKGAPRPYNVRLKTILWNLGQSIKKLAPNRNFLGKSVEEIADILMNDKSEDDDGTTTPVVTAKKYTSRDEALKDAEKKKQDADMKFERLSRPEYLYVRRYYERKIFEEIANERGDNKERAFRELEERKRKNRPISDAQRKIWSEGKLQRAGLDLRAIRWSNRLFLNHFFEVGRTIYYGVAPKPWVIEHGGHVHYIAPPNWPLPEPVKKTRKKKETVEV